MNILVGITILLILLVFAVNGQYREYKTDLASFRQLSDYYDTKSGESRSKPRRYADRPHRQRQEKFRFPDSSEEINGKPYEDDNNYRSYTIGTHFQVGNPSAYVARKNAERGELSAPNKHGSSGNSPSKSFSNFRLSNAGSSNYRDYTLPSSSSSSPSRSRKKQSIKLSRPDPISSSLESDEYERRPSPRSRNKNKRYNSNIDDDDDNDSDNDSSDGYYDNNGFVPSYGYQDRNYNKKNFDLKNIQYPRESQFRGIASKKQIEKYLEDQQELIDDAIQLRLLNDPSPSAKGKYHQFLKSKDDERIEKEYEEELKKKPPILFKGTSHMPKRLSHIDPIKVIRKVHSSPGLGQYHTKTGGAYSLKINLKKK